MKIHVRLFASLRDRLPRADRGRGDVELRDGARLPDLLDHLGIPVEQSQMVLIDGQQSPRQVAQRAAIPLSGGHTVSIFPPLAGG